MRWGSIGIGRIQVIVHFKIGHVELSRVVNKVYLQIHHGRFGHQNGINFRCETIRARSTDAVCPVTVGFVQ